MELNLFVNTTNAFRDMLRNRTCDSFSLLYYCVFYYNKMHLHFSLSFFHNVKLRAGERESE